MRVCLFSPSLDTLISGDAMDRVRHLIGAGDHEIVRLTNSWADIPDNQDVYATGAAHTMSMRLSRRALTGGAFVAGCAARVLGNVMRPAMLEGLRAADPDLIVCVTDSAAAHLQVLLRSAAAPWPCISLNAERAPSAVAPWRRYDPTAKVSIVLPTYNGTRYLHESIASCLEQTHRHLELIIVDDGSSDRIEDIVSAFDDPRIVFVQHARNQGLPASLNTGFARATGTFCTWTSDDNAYLPNAIEHMVRFIQTYPEVDFVYADSYPIDATGAVDRHTTLKTRPPESLAHDNYIGACFLYKRAVYEAVGDYSPSAVLTEDYDYWVRVARQFTMQRLFRRLYRYRFHSASLTARSDRAEVARRVQTVRQQLQRQVWSWHR